MTALAALFAFLAELFIVTGGVFAFAAFLA